MKNDTKMKRFYSVLLILAFLLAFRPTAGAQQFSVSTNAVDWANFVTLNAEAGMAVARHISVHGGVRVNPWVYRPGDPEVRFVDATGEDERQFQNKKQAYSLGVRYWPWYVFSGIWFSARGQYMEYDRGGVFGIHEREAGDSWGLGLGVGYTYMLHENWNLDFGAGVWGGYTRYGTYRCTNCGQPTGTGDKGFILPDFISLSVMYIF